MLNERDYRQNRDELIRQERFTRARHQITPRLYQVHKTPEEMKHPDTGKKIVFGKPGVTYEPPKNFVQDRRTKLWIA